MAIVGIDGLICVESLETRHLGSAGGGEVLLNEERAERHAEVFVGLIETQTPQILLLFGAVDLARELVDGAAERRGEMLAQRRHDPPQHVVVKNPETENENTPEITFQRKLWKLA